MPEIFFQPDFSYVMAILGALQGIILFGFLFNRRKNKSNLFLSFYVLFFSINIISYTDPTYEIYIKYPYLVVLVDVVPFLHIPLMYFYFLYSLNKKPVLRIPPGFHFIPALINIIIMNFIFFENGIDNFKEIVTNSIRESQHIVIAISNWLKFSMGIFYTSLIIKLVLSYGKKYSVWKKNKNQMIWLISLSLTIVFCWIVVITTGAVVFVNKMNTEIVKIFVTLELVVLTGTMYLITYFTFKYPQLFPEQQTRDKLGEKLNLNADKLSMLEIEWEKLMNEEEYYLDEDISLQSTARKLNTHVNVVSYFVNEKFDKNFNECINDLRISFFIKLLKQHNDRTILDLAYESGFSSKTTFNRVFKEKFNRTPVEYKNQIHNS